jgi:hypothetical protein
MTPSSDHQVIEQTIKMPLDHYEMIVENNRMLKSVIAQITGETWLTTNQAAKYIKKSVTHLRGRLKDEIGYSQPGNEIVFRREDLDRYLMRDYKPAKD